MNRPHPMAPKPATPSGRVGPGTARRQLQAALDSIEIGTPDKIRHAHLMAVKAQETLEVLVAKLAVEDADAHRRHAIKAAKNLRDARGRKRSPITMPGYHVGRPSPNKGKKYKATPPSINDVLQMLALAPSLNYVTRGTCTDCGAQGPHAEGKGDTRHRVPAQRHTNDCRNIYGERLRAAILLLWRGGFRVGCELVRLEETDLNPDQGTVYVANGKGGKARDVVVDDWIWPLLEPWLAFRQTLPAGPLFCVIDGPTAGVRSWNPHNLRLRLHELAAHAGVRQRVAPHQFRHAMACEQVLEGIPELFVSRNMGHADLGVTSRYLMGMPQGRVQKALRSRPMPQISMLDALRNEGVQLKQAGRPTPDLMGTLGRAQKELIAA